MPTNLAFANYCCDLLASAGRCIPKRMFGGFGISTDGLTVAIVVDAGDGQKLWLKGGDETREQYAAAGCKIYRYTLKGVPRTMNYFTAPEEAMDSPDAMRPWAALALGCALRARAVKGLVKPKTAAKVVAKRASRTTSKKPKS